MTNSYDVIKSMLRTEKSTLFLPDNKYLFWVDKRENKVQIKRAVEEIY
jgi:ribosomal protein L23